MSWIFNSSCDSLRRRLSWVQKGNGGRWQTQFSSDKDHSWQAESRRLEWRVDKLTKTETERKRRPFTRNTHNMETAGKRRNNWAAGSKVPFCLRGVFSPAKADEMHCICTYTSHSFTVERKEIPWKWTESELLSTSECKIMGTVSASLTLLAVTVLQPRRLNSPFHQRNATNASADWWYSLTPMRTDRHRRGRNKKGAPLSSPAQPGAEIGGQRSSCGGQPRLITAGVENKMSVQCWESCLHPREAPESRSVCRFTWVWGKTAGAREVCSRQLSVNMWWEEENDEPWKQKDKYQGERMAAAASSQNGQGWTVELQVWVLWNKSFLQPHMIVHVLLVYKRATSGCEDLAGNGLISGPTAWVQGQTSRWKSNRPFPLTRHVHSDTHALEMPWLQKGAVAEGPTRKMSFRCQFCGRWRMNDPDGDRKVEPWRAWLALLPPALRWLRLQPEERSLL